MTYRGRFAPSPTGDLHEGSLLAAVASWLRARQQGGAWLVRVDDIDPPREVPGSAASIQSTLASLALHPDEPVWLQSTRHSAYRDAFESLRTAGLVYACWCSRADLAATGGIHRGSCLSPPCDREPAWRLRAGDAVVAWHDLVAGEQAWPVADGGDFVVLRADGLWSYQLACAVDDAAQGISEVVRGRDLIDSTPRQILLQRLLGLPAPAYAHLPLLVDTSGGKLAKSTQAPAVDADGLPALRRTLARLGLPGAPDEDAATMLGWALRRFDLASLAGKVAIHMAEPL
ncbi:MAG TPA: tRNA glutamyl-Q(34) synthetase GluQRS [Pinirhizobacter sp.]|uniref:tRNA glutamyl-Q(34) synthetase GluQRS n=1 Tax=Pinirhizobacter sp. TaxID=2950432 RepID=UPI002BA176F4|nr:tRNA glutamyl-Q(34) synthetase GluQRS [Pinirhizobacter sp.]HMH67813.1 tRNA glutamyl-Q(34) synthetase GluQRS [Pinirhizobacter sp.]